MKAEITRLDKHKEGDRFYLTVWFKFITGDDKKEYRIKMTKAHLKNLIKKDRLSKSLKKGMIIHVCDSKKGKTIKLFNIYDYDRSETK